MPDKYKNRVELTVRLGREPEMRYLPTGKALTTARAALNVGRDKPAFWLTLKAFGTDDGDDSLPNALNALGKGEAVDVVGRLDYREYQKDNGEQGSELSVVLYSLTPHRIAQAPAEYQPTMFDEPAPEATDEIPF